MLPMKGRHTLKETFTTPEIEQLPLQIQRGRLKEWLESGHIVASVEQGKGRGTKHIFSRDDLYAIILYKELLDGGVKRKLAGSIVQDFFYNLSGFSRAIKEHMPYLIVTCYTAPGEKPEIHSQLLSKIPSNLPPTCTYQWSFNLENIKVRVDEVVG